MKSFSFALLLYIAADSDNKIRSGTGADVPNAVHGSLGDEKNVAGRGAFCGAVVLELECALANTDDLSVLDAMRWIARNARRLGGFVRRNMLSGRELSTNDIAALTAVRVLAHGQRLEVVDV
jgi:hypothetical protein